MIIVVSNQYRQRIWLTLRYDIYKDVIHIALFPRQPPQSPRTELYQDLHDGQYIKLGMPEWSESTTVEFDVGDLDPKPKRQDEEVEGDDGVIRVFTFKLTNGAH